MLEYAWKYNCSGHSRSQFNGNHQSKGYLLEQPDVGYKWLHNLLACIHSVIVWVAHS